MAEKQLCLLSLDGGGVRGLSMLFILHEIMNSISQNPVEASSLKPCDYFDLIGGTSTGGLIAIMLGRLEMSVKDCFDAYLKTMDSIFVKKHNRISLRFRVQEQFDHQVLEAAIKSIITSRGLDEDALLYNPNGKCKVFVCSTTKESSTIRPLATFPARGAGDLIHYTTIWQAARATSAAPSFFSPMQIGPFGEKFLDGGTGANNPVQEVWKQAKQLWSESDLTSQIRCIVSLGTGVPKSKGFGDMPQEIVETLLRMATDTQKIAQDFHQQHSDLDDERRYFRFNVDRGLEDVRMEKSKEKAKIAEATRTYVGTQTVVNNLQRCGELLREKTDGTTLTKAEKGCLDTLYFNYKERRSQIKIRDSGSHWVLKHPYFLDWQKQMRRDESNGILWIEGHPGSGKSVAMKQIAEHVRLSNQNTDEKTIIIEFYFSARGSYLAKSPDGLFRSLLHQLLLETPPLPKDLVELYNRKSDHRRSEDVTWELTETKNLLRHALQRPNQRPITIIIDALDECEEGIDKKTKTLNMEKVFLFFSELMDENAKRKEPSPLSLCMSCRHFPCLRFENCLQITVEDHNSENIEDYLNRKLKLKVDDTKDDTLSDLKEDILHRSSGVFLWVKLVVERLREDDHAAKTIRTMRKSLEDVPRDLYSLFEHLLSEIDSQDRSESLQLFQWVLLSLRPLIAREIRDALAISRVVRPDSPKSELIDSWVDAQDTVPTSEERFETYIRTKSKGLIELVVDKESNDAESFWYRRVQVIHESVRNFFLGGLDPKINRQPLPKTKNSKTEAEKKVERVGLCILEPSLKDTYVGKSHEKMLLNCIKYLRLVGLHPDFDGKNIEFSADVPNSRRASVFSNSSSGSSNGAADTDSRFRDKRPQSFLNYCATYALDHACLTSRSHDSEEDLAGLLLQNGNAALIALLINNYPSKLDLDGDFSNLKAKTVVLALACEYHISSCLRSLLDDSATQKDMLIPYSWEESTPLIIACQSGYESGTKYLLKANVDVNKASSISGKTALHVAVKLKHTKIVKILLRHKSINPRALDYRGRSPLCTASYYPNSQIMDQLLEISSDIQTINEQNPILSAVCSRINSDKKSLEILHKQLANIPDINAEVEGTTPLAEAMRSYSREAVEMVLKAGANPWVGRNFDGTAIYLAARNRSSLAWLVRIMIANDWGMVYNLDEVDEAHGKTLLHWAAESGAADLVDELLEAKASFTIQDVYGETPLHYAAESGHLSIVQALVAAGADVHTRDYGCRNCRTPLDCARDDGVVTFLEEYIAGSS